MKRSISVALFLIFLFSSTIASIPVFAQKIPRFEDYPAGNIYTGPIAPVDLSTKEARKYRTMLKEGASGEPNFAGHFFAVEWGCGTECSQLAVVDAQNGKVFFPFGKDAAISYGYKAKSKLLIVNPPEDMEVTYGSERPEYATSAYYLWDGHLAKLLYKEKSPRK